MTPARVYAGTSVGPYRSEDGGATRVPATDGIGSQPVYTFALSGNAVYAGTKSGVFASSDGGERWIAVGSDGGPVGSITSLVFDSAGNV